MPGVVAVLGSLNVDYTVEVARLPEPGQTVLGGDLKISLGGKGANQAAAAARLGARVRMHGRVGDDSGGEMLRDGLAADGAEVRGLRVERGVPSGSALILVDRQGQNVIAVAPGANGRVDESDADAAASGLGAGDLLVVQLEIPVAAVTRAIERARGRGARVVLNAAPAEAAERLGAGEVDVLVVNEVEARATGLPKAASTVVTLGSAGALVRTTGGEERIPAPEVDVVDTTGAGDAFVGALAAGLAAGSDLTDAVRRAVLAGAAAVTRPGARDSLPTTADLERLFGAEALA